MQNRGPVRRGFNFPGNTYSVAALRLLCQLATGGGGLAGRRTTAERSAYESPGSPFIHDVATHHSPPRACHSPPRACGAELPRPGVVEGSTGQGSAPPCTFPPPYRCVCKTQTTPLIGVASVARLAVRVRRLRLMRRRGGRRLRGEVVVVRHPVGRWPAPHGGARPRPHRTAIWPMIYRQHRVGVGVVWQTRSRRRAIRDPALRSLRGSALLDRRSAVGRQGEGGVAAPPGRDPAAAAPARVRLICAFADAAMARGRRLQLEPVLRGRRRVR